MTLNPEQLELLEGGTPGGFVKPSGAQTPEQPVNMAVVGFPAACQFAGFEPLPSEPSEPSIPGVRAKFGRTLRSARLARSLLLAPPYEAQCMSSALETGPKGL